MGGDADADRIIKFQPDYGWKSDYSYNDLDDASCCAIYPDEEPDPLTGITEGLRVSTEVWLKTPEENRFKICYDRYTGFLEENTVEVGYVWNETVNGYRWEEGFTCPNNAFVPDICGEGASSAHANVLSIEVEHLMIMIKRMISNIG